MRIVLISLSFVICALLRLPAFAGVGHRFYSDEGNGVCFSPEGIHCVIECDTACHAETLRITVRNMRHTPFQPLKAGVKLGVDTYMDKYPEWNEKFFPTLMMCEPRHFYGYLRSPSGKYKAVVSGDPVASWSLDYNYGYQDPAPHWFMGHRVEALNIDLLATPPLPPHHPNDLWQLMPGEERSWILKIVDFDNPEDFEWIVNRETGAPAIAMERTSCSPGEKFSFVVIGKKPKVCVDGRSVRLKSVGKNRWRCETSFPSAGLYNVMAEDSGKVSHGTINVRYPWKRTMELARKGALEHAQKATSHVESWYGFHSAFLAARHFPSDSIDAALDQRFNLIFNNLFSADGKPLKYEWRIQNTSSTVGILVDRFEAFGDMADLDRACRLADWMISYSQKENGAYMNGKTVYSSVIYPAKSIIELADAERSCGRVMDAMRHEASAAKAVAQLVAARGDFNTEGEITYEDGMVSCSALQIGLMALRTHDAALRSKYRDMMLDILHGHECLTQLQVPDGRRRGGTMRYWEAQYDVHMLPNMLSSPHGWSAWRGYAAYYAYLLTGDERWLRETFDTASSLASLIDHQTGKMRWAFVVDPRLVVRQISEADSSFTADIPSYGTPHPDMYPNRSFAIGEQYVDMVAGWQTIVSSDNDVHEAFKFIAESVLTNAFVVEREDGSFGCYNCRIDKKGDRLRVVADESQIRILILNVRKKYETEFDGKIEYICLD